MLKHNSILSIHRQLDKNVVNGHKFNSQMYIYVILSERIHIPTLFIFLHPKIKFRPNP